MNIWAIDPSTKSGWATLINNQIESGVQDFSLKRGESQGIKFIMFNSWLDEIYTRCIKLNHIKLDLIVYEQTYMRYGKALDTLVGMTTRIDEFCAKNDIQCMAVNAGTLKKAITGSGKASKDDMIAWFKEKVGRDPIDDNEADARALLEFTIKKFSVK